MNISEHILIPEHHICKRYPNTKVCDLNLLLYIIFIKDDPYKMNWVIEDTYLQQAGYQDMDKLFGLFDITADGKKTGSEAVNPVIKEEQSKIEISYDFEKFKVKIIYDLSVDAEALFWKIELEKFRYISFFFYRHLRFLILYHEFGTPSCCHIFIVNILYLVNLSYVSGFWHFHAKTPRGIADY